MNADTIRMILDTKAAINVELDAVHAVKLAQHLAERAKEARKSALAGLEGALIGEGLEDPEAVWDRLVLRDDWLTAAAWAGIQAQDPKAPGHWRDRERMALHQPRGKRP